MKICLALFLQSFIYINCFCQQAITKYNCNCTSIGLDSVWADTNKITCYRIPVERNFARPGAKKYFLAVATAPALTTSPKEPLLYLHGGPGIATLSNMPRYLKSKTFLQLRQNHPLVFFDYRGTGFSEPALCNNLGDAVDAISNAKLPAQTHIAKTAAAYAACKEQLQQEGIQLSDFSSLQSAADAEAIRKTLAISNWNIYSVSHGTTVALNMMRSFPAAIRSVILDSPFPPNAPWMDFIHPFDSSFYVLQKTLSQDTAYAALFPLVKNDFIKITKRLHKTPFVLPIKNEKDSTVKSKLFNDGDFAWSVWTAMLDPYTIPWVPLALKEIAAGNDSVLHQWALLFSDADAFGKFALAQSKAILYYESKPRFKEETESYLLKNFPEYAAFITPGLEPALYKAYRPQTAPPHYFKPIKSSIPTLIFAGQYDPVCPPYFARFTAKTLNNATVIIVPAASHAAMYADDCTRSMGKEFYLNPHKKPDAACLAKRKKIDFITSDILSYLK